MTFVHLNGRDLRWPGPAFIKPFVQAITAEVGLPGGVHLAPERDFTRHEELVVNPYEGAQLADRCSGAASTRPRGVWRVAAGWIFRRRVRPTG